MQTGDAGRVHPGDARLHTGRKGKGTPVGLLDAEGEAGLNRLLGTGSGAEIAPITALFIDA